MRVLVTGGKGDLGRRLVERLEKAGHAVVVGTRSPRAGDEVAFDLADEPDRATLADVDVVVHMATDPFQPDQDSVGRHRLGQGR